MIGSDDVRGWKAALPQQQPIGRRQTCLLTETLALIGRLTETLALIGGAVDKHFGGDDIAEG